MEAGQRIIRLLSSEGCGVLPPEDITLEHRLYDLGFDSLRYMELVVLLEEEFGMEVPDSLLDVDAMTTVATLAAEVGRHA
ncbi:MULTISPECIES: acyl carrier protein [Paenibacillus]|uniref:acyl carrier protein n=1 Tax=Paenibacillus TaxID=44249 RepID=UPI00037825E0|nr:acyl carrier protein [Paenibacillus massiliensis]